MSFLDSIAKVATDAAGLKLEDGQIVLTEQQIQDAQDLVTRLLNSSGFAQNWRVVGEPILGKYGWWIGISFSAIVTLGIFIGYKVGTSK